ncbi:MAG: hypothetical protein ACI4TU_10465 [Candidatus Cryptobacteroides sp.]
MEIAERGYSGSSEMMTFAGLLMFGINVPVFANIKGIWEDKKISPTFDMKAGFSLGIACGFMGEAGAGCRFELGKTALAATAFIKGVYEEESLVSDDNKYLEDWFTSLGVKVAYEF